MTSPRPAHRALRRLAAITGATLLGAGLTAAIASPAAAEAGVGYVRLAHLSPDTPAVDVYVDDPAGKIEGLKFPAVPYGVMSGYLAVPPGTYAVSMRKEGAPESEKPVLTTDVTVAEDGAYTVAGVGKFADIDLKVYEDDISAPPAGQAKVRVVQASVRAPILDIAAANGPTIATGVQFATTTPYNAVKPGDWQVKLQPTGGADATTADCPLKSGTTYSLLVLDAEDGGLTTDLKVDATAGEITPEGGVETGAGGTSGGPPYTALVSAGALLLAGVAAAGAIALRRRARGSW
jgi:hypothetical protein